MAQHGQAGCHGQHTQGDEADEDKPPVQQLQEQAEQASPVNVPNRAPIMGTAKARPRSSGGKVAARMALEFPNIMADPKPAIPRHITTCHKSCDSAIKPDPMVDARIPKKKTRA